MKFELQAHPLILCVLALIFIGRAIQHRVTRKLPPGPRGIPFFGNIFQLSLRPWEKFEIWKKQYGSLVYISIAGQGILLINTHEAAFELLNRRGGNYSERPRFVVAAEILTGGLLMALVSYGKLWKRYSLAAHEALYSMKATHHYSIYSKEAILLTDRVLRNTSNWEREISRGLASTTLSVLYDLPGLQCTRDSIVETLDKFTNVFLRTALSPAGQLIELFPWLKYTPSWMAKWKRDSKEGFQRHSQILEGLFDDVRKRIDQGEECPSFVGILIREQQRLNLNKSQAVWLPAAMYIGGSETVSNVMMWFMLAMITYPEKQRSCQEELDAVVGRSRMPTFQDRESLPYLQATIREALRWRPTAPFGFPHCVKKDDWYNGLFIPKGTMCLANIWSLNRDKTIYGDDADDFNPDRFMDEKAQLRPALEDTKDEGHVSFGFGPRLCLGRQMTNNVLFINLASILWATDITPSRDKAGNPILPDTLNAVNDGIVARPPPFKCSIAPRFPEVMGIISQTMEGF